jgi:hypothetical protein
MKNKLFLTTVLVIMLSILTYATLSTTVYAAEITNSQKAKDILSSVVGLNMTAYTTDLNSDIKNTTPSIANLGLPQETLVYNLTSTQGSLTASCTFINGSLNQIYLSNYMGTQALNQPTINTLNMAQNFLISYQSYTGNHFYGSLSSMLNGVAVNTNATATVSNSKLQIFVIGSEQSLVWTYVDNNGVPALAKDVVLTYTNGHLESFLDNWQLYQVTGEPTLSSQDAIRVAMQAVQNYSYIAYNANGANVIETGFKVASIGKATLGYVNYYEDTPQQSVRGVSPLTLYPSWSIALGFDKVYPGNMTGLLVKIWADSGNVSSIAPMLCQPPISSLASSNDMATQVKTDQMSMVTILLPVVAVVASGITAICLYSQKNNLAGLKRNWKFHLSTRKIVAICLVTLTIGVMIASPLVYATSYTLKTELYVSTYKETSMDTQEEQYASAVLSSIQSSYQTYDSGDVVSNNYGSGTVYSNIISQIWYDENNYMGVAVFHFGHGYTPWYLDSNGFEITYNDIYDETYSFNEHYFVWMWTCTLAQNFEFANAWTQQSSLEYYGFDSPDSTQHCFIGFMEESPMISYQSFYGYTQLAYTFIEEFYLYAALGYSVHNALNSASEAVFGVNYDLTPLNEGYYAWWPGGGGASQGWYPGGMNVFGDSNIVLKS